MKMNKILNSVLVSAMALSMVSSVSAAENTSKDELFALSLKASASIFA